jgi:protein DEK
VAADPPADNATENTDPEPVVDVKAEEEQKTPQHPEKRRGRRKKSEVEAEKKTPTPKKPTPGIDRPSRERKTVERYSELAPRITPVKKSPAILQVRKSPLPPLLVPP